MDDSTNSAQPIPEVPPPSNNPDRSMIRPSHDWLMLGFLVLTLALASLVALLILLAYENGSSI